MNTRRPLALLATALGVLVLLLLGAALLLWPEILLAMLPVLVGIVLLLVGVQSIAYAAVMRNRLMAPELRLAGGLVSVIVGVVFFVKQDVSLLFMSALFGLYALVSAAINLSAVAGRARRREPWLGDLLLALLEMLMGVLLLASPFHGLALWVRVLGAYFILAAVGALRWLGRAAREQEGSPSQDQPEE